ncbi:MAG: DUF992 domain-containing protein [Hyphomicrobiales bacterium]|nr:DUF992 domain-containing protein [Hyphomicrobiales bacterium]
MRYFNCAAAFGAAMLAVGLSAGAASAQQTTRVGALECDVSGGVGLIITSSKALDCYFYRDDNGQVEHYVGTIRRIGVAIGATGPGTLDWGVLAPTTGVAPGALAGEYGGVGANATAAVGVGANALVGGSNRTISLQPFSVQAQVGVDVAAGVTDVALEYVPPTQPAKPHVRRHKKK